MTQTFTLPNGWASSLAYAAPNPAIGDRAGLNRLPTEWQTVNSVVLADVVIDHVVVGPNGVFAIAIDPDIRPVTIGEDGLYRSGARLTTTVKSALMGAHELRRRVGPQLFAYPMLITEIDAPGGHLDRLGVIPGGRIPEAIWSHPGRPLTRSQRMETLWSLRSLTA